MANPYHDKEGKFTSKGNQGQAEPKSEMKKQKISLKPGIDLSSFPAPTPKPVAPSDTKPYQKKLPTAQIGTIDTSFELVQPSSIDEATAQVNKILGSNSIASFKDDTNLEQAFEMTKALKDVVSEFPNVFKGQLLSFGTSVKNFQALSRDDKKQIFMGILSSPEYAEESAFLNKYGIDTDSWSKRFYMSGIKDFDENELDKFYKNNNNTWGVTVHCETPFSIFNPKEAPRTADMVVINPNHMRHDVEMSISKAKSAILFGNWFDYGDKTPTYQTTTHELGHHIYNQLYNLFNTQEIQQISSLTRGKDRLRQQGEISGYAASGKRPRDEQIAEAFSDYYCRGNNATAHNKQIVNFFKGVYKRIYG